MIKCRFIISICLWGLCFLFPSTAAALSSVTVNGGGMEKNIHLNMTKKELISQIGAPERIKGKNNIFSYETFGLSVMLDADLKVNRIYLDRNFKGTITGRDGAAMRLGGGTRLEAITVEGRKRDVHLGMSEADVVDILGHPDATTGSNGSFLNYGHLGAVFQMSPEKRVDKIYLEPSFRGRVVGTNGDDVFLDGIARTFGEPMEIERQTYAPSSSTRNKATVELESRNDFTDSLSSIFPMEYRGQRKLYELYGKGIVLKYKYVLDEDGIAFYLDHNRRLYTTVLYPPILPPAAVSQSPGPADEVICLEMVHFDFDKSAIKSVYIPVLNKWVAYLKQHPEAYVTIEGHTDAKGSGAYNQGLSERRSLAVYNYFIGKGIDPDRLNRVGYSENQPIAPNQTPSGEDDPEGRAVNRRVQFKVSQPR